MRILIPAWHPSFAEVDRHKLHPGYVDCMVGDCERCRPYREFEAERRRAGMEMLKEWADRLEIG